MGDTAVVRLEARFALDEKESTCLMVEREEQGRYELKGRYQKDDRSYRSYYEQSFPSFETLSRVGLLSVSEVEELFRKVRLICRRNWYHHNQRGDVNRRTTYYDMGYQSHRSWQIELEQEDGSIERWDGVGYAPEELDELYQVLITYAMPPVVDGSFASCCFSELDGPGDPSPLTCYHDLFCAVDEGETSDEWSLLVREFVEDTVLYLGKYYPDTLSPQGRVVWDLADDIQGLCDTDVSSAPRTQMMALFGAIASRSDAMDAARTLVESGTLGLWCERLRKIPHEEWDEMRRQEEEERRLRLAHIDEVIRERVEGAQPFTAMDVAQECGVTTQQASGRIRRFVKQGELLTVGTETPRVYQAA